MPRIGAAAVAANQHLMIAALLVGVLAVIVAVSSAGGETVLGPATNGGAGAGASLDSSNPAGDIVVDVTGAVANPGVYHLATGARVGDAIDAAGGFGPRVDVERVAAELNLASALSDGAQVRVPSRDDAAATGSGGGGGSSGGSSGGSGGSTGGVGGAGGLLNLNTATQAELEALPGIGPVTATRILESRAGAPFTRVEELTERDLVGDRTFGQIRALVTAG